MTSSPSREAPALRRCVASMLIGFGAVGFAMRRRQKPVLAQLA